MARRSTIKRVPESADFVRCRGFAKAMLRLHSDLHLSQALSDLVDVTDEDLKEMGTCCVFSLNA